MFLLNYLLLPGCVRRKHIRSDFESDLNSQNRAFANLLENRGGTLLEGKNLNVFNGDDLPFNA